MEILRVLAEIGLLLVALKAMWIGSEFNFSHWRRDGKKYLEWYKNRETYEQHLKTE